MYLLSMRIIPIHQWKVPLKYQAMLLFPIGPLGLGGAADTMVLGGGGGTYEVGGTKIYELIHTEATYEFNRGALIMLPKHPLALVATATAVAAACHLPPLQPRLLRS